MYLATYPYFVWHVVAPYVFMIIVILYNWLFFLVFCLVNVYAVLYGFKALVALSCVMGHYILPAIIYFLVHSFSLLFVSVFYSLSCFAV